MADLVVFTASALRERLPAVRRREIIRKACEFGRFASAAGHRMSDLSTVDYVGAVDHWFDMDLFNRRMQSRPDWDFVLAGSRAGLREGSLVPRPNFRLLGEVDSADIPGLVAGFDGCLVPFVENELTSCVNPVRVYEYLVAGKPAVATPPPEIRLLPPQLVRLASSGRAFLTALDRAVDERKDAVLAAQRRQWGSGQAWSARADEFLETLVE